MKPPVLTQLIALHQELAARLLNNNEVSAAEIDMLIDQGRAIAHRLSFIEDRQELREILNLWASRQSRLHGYHPDVDIDDHTTQNLPRLQSRTRPIRSSAGNIPGSKPRVFPISVEDLGQVEGNLPGLKRVVVVAHRIEPPLEGLRRSAANNLRKGVRYDFLVSESVFSQDPWRINLYAALVGQDESLRKNLHFWSLSTEWTDLPLIFYQFTPPTSNEDDLLVVCGDQRQEGLADRYSVLQPSPARAMLRMLASTVPEDSQISSLTGRFSNEKIINLITRAR